MLSGMINLVLESVIDGEFETRHLVDLSHLDQKVRTVTILSIVSIVPCLS